MPVASKVAEYPTDTLCQRCSYVISYESYVRQLKGGVERLRDVRDRVQDSINEARKNKKRIEADVMRWKKDVQTVANKARDILEQDGRAKKTCFCRWLPKLKVRWLRSSRVQCLPNLKLRYHLGREARRTILDIQALILRSRFEKVYYESDPDVNYVAGDQGVTITD
ncbi:hypothetical protein EUGRSUZ_G01354 [Eucalyptus grandis]|uniref:Uncharacterized protein n=2 Tax=Eucalyptus grandis TaxID=71139 RepID=A0ACC3K3L5_EUCGR|nr:hypothetical protein EUGRSUZ_G01354 [Eucalyptus grandis]